MTPQEYLPVICQYFYHTLSKALTLLLSLKNVWKRKHDTKNLRKLKQNPAQGSDISGPSLERVPRVPRNPSRFVNGFQEPVLR